MPCEKLLRRFVLNLDRCKQSRIFAGLDKTFHHSVAIALPSVAVRSMQISYFNQIFRLRK